MPRTPRGAARRVPSRTLAIAAALVLLLLAAGVALAEESFLGGKLRAGDTVSVPAGETVSGDLYVFAGTTTIDGTVEGDLTVFAGTVQLNAPVGEDLLVAGGTVTIADTVAGDVRVAGGTVTVIGAIGEDLVVAGGQVSTAASGTVGGDLVVTAGEVTVAGDVEGNIEGAAGAYRRSGSVGGTENVRIEEREVPTPVVDTTALDAVRHFVIVVLFGGLLLWLLPRPLRAAGELLRARPLAALGSGLAAIVGYVVFVIAILLLVILLGLIFGLAQLGAIVAIEVVAGVLTLLAGSFLFVLAVAYLADIVVALTLGRLVVSGALGSRWHELGLLAAGAAAVVVLTTLPGIGGLAKLVVILFGLGAVTALAYRTWRARRPAPDVPSDEPLPPIQPPPARTPEPSA